MVVTQSANAVVSTVPLTNTVTVAALGPQGPQGASGASAPDASTTVKGFTKLSVAPVSAVIPIAAGDNDSRLTNARTPTAHHTTHETGGSDVVSVTKTQVGLGNVDNTADAAKPVSTAQQTALDLKSNLASPTLTGDPKAPTPSVGDNDTSIATTAFVKSAFVSGSRMIVGLTYQSGNGANGVKTPANTSDTRGCHILIGRDCTLDRLGCEVTTGVATALADVAMYDHTGNLIIATGAVIDCSTTGIKLVTINQAVSAGLYWIFVGPRTAVAGFRATGVLGTEPRNTFQFANAGMTLSTAFPSTITIPPAVAVDIAVLGIVRASA